MQGEASTTSRAGLVALLSLLGALAVAPTADELDAVRKAFTRYQSALLAKDGSAAAAAVSANSLAFYDRMRNLALAGTKAEIQALDGTEQVLVLSLRVRAPRPLLRSGSPDALIAYAVDQGMISAGTVARTQLGEITLHGTEADATLLLDGHPVPGAGFRFHREGDVWNFDLEHASLLARGIFGRLAEQRGVSQEALILELLSKTSGRSVGPEVWDPPDAR